MPEPTNAPAPTDTLPEVEVLHWPTQEHRRRLLAALGEPRILLLAPNSTPPALIDNLELWIPEGTDPLTIVQGVTKLQKRILEIDAQPVLDDDGLLWFKGRWVAVSDNQIPVVDLLIQNYRRLVRNDDLIRAYQDGGGSGTDASLRNLIRRVATRLANVGLNLHVVRKRGVILATDETRTHNTVPNSHR